MDESSLRARLNQLEGVRSSLHSWFRFWDWVVVVGVALEFIGLVTEYWGDWQAFRRATIRSPEEPRTWLFIVGICGIAMVAGGITRELGINSQIESVETQIRGANEQLFGIVSRESERAALSAKTAHEEADAARVEADAVSAKAGQINASLAMVQWGLGARHILNEPGLENDLEREFKGKIVVFTSYVQDEEAFSLCKQLVSYAGKPEVGVIAEDECAAEPLPPYLPITNLRITAPSIEEAQRLGMIIKRAGVAGWVVNLGLTPEITVLVGREAAIPLFWPKATASPGTIRPGVRPGTGTTAVRNHSR